MGPNGCDNDEYFKHAWQNIYDNQDFDIRFTKIGAFVFCLFAFLTFDLTFVKPECFRKNDLEFSVGLRILE